MKKNLFPVCVTFALLTAPISAAEPCRLIFEETFDGDVSEGFAMRMLQHRHVSLVESGGPDGSNAIRVAYVGYDLGSERVVLHYPLNTSLQQATLVFDVMFEDGFQWTMGGKLHGLGPAKPRTGRDTPREDGRSARIMFNPHRSSAIAAGKHGQRPLDGVVRLFQAVVPIYEMYDAREDLGLLKALLWYLWVLAAESPMITVMRATKSTRTHLPHSKKDTNTIALYDC